MKKEFIKKLHDSIKEEIPNAHSMIIINDEEDDVSCSLAGVPAEIAEAILALASNPKHPLYNEILNIIMNVVCNIIETPSQLSNAMIEVIREAIQKNIAAQSAELSFIKKGEA